MRGQTTPGLQADPSPRFRWNGFGYWAGGSSLIKSQGGLSGGGGGIEAYIWKGLTVGGSLTAFHDSDTSRGLGHGCADLSYHFAGRQKLRGMDPFLDFGLGGFFSDEAKRVEANGGGGFTYWFKDRLGIRFEFQVNQRTRGDDIVGLFRIGITFR